jgi:hypothetical protein
MAIVLLAVAALRTAAARPFLPRRSGPVDVIEDHRENSDKLPPLVAGGNPRPCFRELFVSPKKCLRRSAEAAPRQGMDLAGNDTLRRDFGHDPALLRQQVVVTVRHELAHHIGFDELGVQGLGL